MSAYRPSMTDEPTVGPEPTEILSKAAAVENIVTC